MLVSVANSRTGLFGTNPSIAADRASPKWLNRAARHRDLPRRRALCEQQAVLQGVIHMQTTSLQTRVRRDGTLLRTARAVGRWFSRAVNAIGQPYAKPEADHWATGRTSPHSERCLSNQSYPRNRKPSEAGNPVKVTKDQTMTSYEDLSVKVAP